MFAKLASWHHLFSMFGIFIHSILSSCNSYSSSYTSSSSFIMLQRYSCMVTVCMAICEHNYASRTNHKMYISQLHQSATMQPNKHWTELNWTGIYILFKRFPTGSQGTSPKAHFSWRCKYRLSVRALSRASSETGDLVVWHSKAFRVRQMRANWIIIWNITKFY